MTGDLLAQVTALASLVDRNQRRLGEVESMLRQLAADLEARLPEDSETETDSAVDERAWLLVADPEHAREVLADLTGWLTEVYLHYPDTALPSCWLWHPAVVEELWSLRQAHRDAYSGHDGTPAKATDWHDRYRPGVTHRIRTALRDCELALHQPPRPAPAVPLVGSADRVADTWATARTTPSPTPDELTTAEHHDRAQYRNTHR